MDFRRRPDLTAASEGVPLFADNSSPFFVAIFFSRLALLAAHSENGMPRLRSIWPEDDLAGNGISIVSAIRGSAAASCIPGRLV